MTDLPRRFINAGTQVVILAACRKGEEEQRTLEQAGSLLDRLVPLRLADITREEAEPLIVALREDRVVVRVRDFDGTPGSLLLGVIPMCERYRNLPEDARRVLRALKLLHSTRIHTYPEQRVRAVAEALFHLPPSDGAWQEARSALVRTEFLHPWRTGLVGIHETESIAEVYLEEAVLDYPDAGVTEAESWSLLEQCFQRLRDASALLSLGNAFNAHQL